VKPSWLLLVPVLFIVLGLPAALHHWSFRPGIPFGLRHVIDFWLTILAVLVVVLIVGVVLLLVYVETNQ
jgi:hypothetical protein